VRFAGLPDGRTRRTQRVVLTGEQADLCLSEAKAAFTASLPEGMSKLASAMANGDPNRESAGRSDSSSTRLPRRREITPEHYPVEEVPPGPPVDAPA